MFNELAKKELPSRPERNSFYLLHSIHWFNRKNITLAYEWAFFSLLFSIYFFSTWKVATTHLVSIAYVRFQGTKVKIILGQYTLTKSRRHSTDAAGVSRTEGFICCCYSSDYIQLRLVDTVCRHNRKRKARGRDSINKFWDILFLVSESDRIELQAVYSGDRFVFARSTLGREPTITNQRMKA